MALKNFGIQRDGPQSPATTRLRAMLRSGTMVVAPFVLNAYHARIAEAVGFQVVYMTGFGTAAERGYPDVGLVTQTEMVENARYIASAVDVPVLCDADTGYGNPINVTRTIREYEAAGVAGCHIEDQVFPKKCGFFAGKQVVPLEEHVQKIRAALAARWIGSLKHFWRRPAGAAHCTAERGTARRELVLGTAGVPWGDGRGISHGLSTRIGGRDTCAARTSPPRPHATAWA